MNSLVIYGRKCGFLSNFLHFVDNLKYCDDNGIKPLMRLNGQSNISIHQGFLYTDGRDNVWNHYFKEINDNVEEGTVEMSCFFKKSNFIMKNGWDDGQNKSLLWDFVQSGNKEQEMANRAEVSVTVMKYMIPADNINAVVEDFREKNFIGGRMLGVHVRGTDYGFHNFDAYTAAIDQQIGNYDKIYLATDNKESVRRMKEKYGDKVCYFDTPRRSENFIDTVAVFNPAVITSPQAMLQHGEDVWIETNLLTKCNHLIGINSNVTMSVLYLNPTIPFTMVGRTSVGG